MMVSQLVGPGDVAEAVKKWLEQMDYVIIEANYPQPPFHDEKEVTIDDGAAIIKFLEEDDG